MINEIYKLGQATDYIIPELKEGKPFLFDIVNEAYHFVMDIMPKSLQERSIGSAFVLGFLGNYTAFKLVQGVSDILLPESFNQKYLPLIEKACILGTLTSPLVYSFIDPQGMQEVTQKHPTYTWGMIGAGLGAIWAAYQDINNKKLEKIFHKKPAMTMEITNRIHIN